MASISFVNSDEFLSGVIPPSSNPYDKAKALLLSILTGEQKLRLKITNTVFMKGLSGMDYQVRHPGLVQIVIGHHTATGWEGALGLCVNARAEYLPSWDQMYTLVRLLQSKGGENYLFTRGNVVGVEITGWVFPDTFTGALQQLFTSVQTALRGNMLYIRNDPVAFSQAVNHVMMHYGRSETQYMLETIMAKDFYRIADYVK